jgi:1,4-alpha-glucan branching enzyme
MKNTTMEKVAGMGALVTKQGVAFRVWAPNAEKVYVTGSFNHWDEMKHPLDPEENGYWYGYVKEASIGDEYKFVIINHGRKLLKNDPYARQMTNSAGNGLIVNPVFDWEDDSYNVSAWNELVIYEIHVGTFNSPKRNMPGNFKSLKRKIPHLKKLGINAIEIMPPVEFPGDFSWGYNPAYIFAVESAYGTPEDFKALVKEAHKNGIAVILDVVYNHLGPQDIDIWQFDGWTENEGGGIYFYNDWRAETPWGNTRPDFGRGEVRQFLRDNAMMWLEEYHLDGFRFDATAYIRNVHGANNDPGADLEEGWAFLQWINNELKENYKNKITIAEDLYENPWLTKTTGEGGAGFGAQVDISFASVVRDCLIEANDEDRNMEALAVVIAKRIDDDAFARVIYTEAHDDIAEGKLRIPEIISPGDADNWFSRKRSVLGAALLLTTPGMPMLFQGQEFLEDRWFHDRDPLDWNLADKYQGLINLYSTLISLRRNQNGTTRGLTGQNLHIHHVNNSEKILAFHRWYDGGSKDSVVVIANFRNSGFEQYVVGFPSAGKWKVRFNSDWKGYDEEFTDNYTGEPEAMDGETDGMPCHAAVSMGPYALLILSQD